MILNDVRVGDCFRFANPDENEDTKYRGPTYADTKRRGSGLPKGLPEGWDATDVDDQRDHPEWWEDNGEREIELLEHYSRSPEPVALTRAMIKVGEAFEHLDVPGEKVVMAAPPIDWGQDLPKGWKLGNVTNQVATSKLVRRIPRWDHVGAWAGIPRPDAPAKPIVASPLADLLAETCGGLTGEECLRRLELAMQTESLARSWAGSTDMVSTFGEGLDHRQVALARHVWSAKLAALSADARRRDVARAVVVLVDIDDEDKLGPWRDPETE